MSILRPINYAGAWEFKSPVPAPVSDVGDSPRVSISFNADWIPAVFSALKVLTRPEAWVGTLGDIQRCTSDAHNLLDYGSGGTMVVGLIIAHMLDTLPANWLPCDGGTYLRVDWPDLYAVIDSAYVFDADHFITPDLMGRSPLGAGSGSGLSTRGVNAMGGEEGHVLTVSELAAHNHPRNSSGLDEVILTTSTASADNAWVAGPLKQLIQGVTGNRGSDTAHNTMHPFTVVKYAIVAGV